MQRFTIDFLTGNAGNSYQEPNITTDAQIQVANHDGLLTHIGSNYLHTSLHLEDVYSVINKDTEHTSTSAQKHMTSPLVIDSSYTNVGSSTSPIVIDSSFVSTCDVTSPSGTTSGSDVSPLPSPEDASIGYQYTLERATPSPNKDSGIESDNSPVSEYTSEDVKKSLRELEKKADKIKTSTKTSKKTETTDKPSHSYIALIALAILDSRDLRMTLGDIYRHIMDNYPYYNNEEKAWRNSIRYNLSINECFIKVGKDEIVGKGNLWGIHPACLEDFKNGDFRRRQARRRAKKTLKGIGTEDNTTDYTRLNSYQTMTPSYVNYHPYTTGLVRQQPMADYAHAYSGHYQMPSASYYNTLGHYPAAAQQTTYGIQSYAQPTYDYSQHYTSTYPSYEVNGTSENDSEGKDRQDSGHKHYTYSSQGIEQGVPTNNKIEIL